MLTNSQQTCNNNQKERNISCYFEREREKINKNTFDLNDEKRKVSCFLFEERESEQPCDQELFRHN